MKKPKARKPKPLDKSVMVENSPAYAAEFARVGDYWCDAKDCRKLAAWLLKAADYLEGK